MRPGEDAVSMTRQEQMVRREKETHMVGVPTEVTIRSSDEALVHVLESLAEEIGGVGALVVGERGGLPIVSTVPGPSAVTTTAIGALPMSGASKGNSILDLPVPDHHLVLAGGLR